jgi:mannosyl-oligosaccharide alpha-1,2-mannosidase
MGMTILDSLDTLWLMEMTGEFHKGFEFVSNPSLLSFDRLVSAVSTFETGIRALGGLLSAHSLMAREEAREKAGKAEGKAEGKAVGKKLKAGVILAKAVDLGDRLLRAFNTPTGLPTMRVDLSAGGGGGGGGGGRSTLADVGSMQLELRYLAKASGRPKYATAANRVAQWGYDRLRSSGNGLLGVNIDVQSGMASGHLSMGGSGDSFYEYLIKSFIQGGVREPKLREMYVHVGREEKRREKGQR